LEVSKSQIVANKRGGVVGGFERGGKEGESVGERRVGRAGEVEKSLYTVRVLRKVRTYPAPQQMQSC